jgi:hypothetical protein
MNNTTTIATNITNITITITTISSATHNHNHRNHLSPPLSLPFPSRASTNNTTETATNPMPPFCLQSPYALGSYAQI